MESRQRKLADSFKFFSIHYKDVALHKKSESGWTQRQRRGVGLSAEGARYDSQGQALSNAKRVAPGYQISIEESTESAKYRR